MVYPIWIVLYHNGTKLDWFIRVDVYIVLFNITMKDALHAEGLGIKL